jgi:hypothetical protein
MPSPRPPMTGSVKVIKSTSSFERDIKNIKETSRVLAAKEGTTAKRESFYTEIRNRNIKPEKTVQIRTNPGVTGAGAKNVAKLYRGGGIGMFGLPKNK